MANTIYNMVLKLERKKKLCQVSFKLMMILIQQFLRIHVYSNPTDKNLTLKLNLNRFLCGGGLK